MGDVLSGIFGGGEKQTQDQTADPISQELNKLRLQQLSSLFGTSSYSSYAQPRDDIYSESPAVTALFEQGKSDVASNDYSSLMSLNDYIDMGLDESRNFISQIATPEILSTAALQGLEGGGFVPEAIGKATASIALPFLQGLPEASRVLSLVRPQAEALRAGTGLTNAQRATTLFPLADYGRALSEQDMLRQQGVVTTGLTGLPFTPTTDTTAKKSSQPLFNWFGQG